MTLNITAVDSWILQVSDRRLTVVHSDNTVEVCDDKANKAVVLSCRDAVLAVTYTGLGRFYQTGVDEWLVDTIQAKGLCELDADAAVTQLTLAVNAWFLSFRDKWHGPHTFVVAGWIRSGKAPPQSKIWFITNTQSKQHDLFDVTSVDHVRGQLFVTGYTPAFTRPERRRLAAALKQSKGRFAGVEAAFVAAIRNAAADPKSEFIGKNCMAVALLPDRSVFARFYPEGGAPSNFGPNVAWYSGGRNFATSGVSFLSDGPYAIVIGSAPTWVVVRPASSIGAAPSTEVRASFKFKFGNAVHRPNDAVEDSDIIRIVGLSDLPPFLADSP